MDEKEFYRTEALRSLDFSKWELREDGVAENGIGNFRSYFTTHYKPLLDKLADCEYQKIGLSDKEKRLLGWMRDDLNTIFSEGE